MILWKERQQFWQPLFFGIKESRMSANTKEGLSCYDGERTYHLLSDGVVSWLQVLQHLSHNLLSIATVTHGIEQVHCPLANTHVTLRL